MRRQRVCHLREVACLDITKERLDQDMCKPRGGSGRNRYMERKESGSSPRCSSCFWEVVEEDEWDVGMDYCQRQDNGSHGFTSMVA